MAATVELPCEVTTAPVCLALGLSRATVYRRKSPAPVKIKRPRPRPARALVPRERQKVLDTLHAKRFCDQSPVEVYATLLEEDRYLCSPRTMYRILADSKEVRERRNQLRHPAYAKPELLATKPDEVWSWDITKLLGKMFVRTRVNGLTCLVGLLEVYLFDSRLNQLLETPVAGLKCAIEHRTSERCPEPGSLIDRIDLGMT